MEIVIMRHGQTDGNREGRYLGRTDVPLNEAGEAEAIASGVLPAVEKVYVSPMIRARRTGDTPPEQVLPCAVPPAGRRLRSYSPECEVSA